MVLKDSTNISLKILVIRFLKTLQKFIKKYPLNFENFSNFFKNPRYWAVRTPQKIFKNPIEILQTCPTTIFKNPPINIPKI